MNKILNRVGLFPSRIEGKTRVYAPAIVWFCLIAIVVYAFYCTSRGYNFGIIINPFKVGCYVR